jgi:hypothetical protein
MFGPLIRYLENTNPQEFKLTEDIRSTFANSKYGAVLLELCEVPVRLTLFVASSIRI